MKTVIAAIFVLSFFVSKAQSPYQSLDTIKAPAAYDNMYVKPLYTDSANASSFVIFIRNEVKAHKHLTHSEHVVVLAGMGMMTLGDKKFKVKKGE